MGTAASVSVRKPILTSERLFHVIGDRLTPEGLISILPTQKARIVCVSVVANKASSIFKTINI